jgi:transposase
MRGDDQQLQSGMFSYVALEDRIPADHPLRGVRKLVDAVLAGMSKDFEGLYSKVGRPSIPPERLLRALLLQVFYSVRSERLLMEQLNYNLLFRWFVGLEIDDPVWNHAVFSKNRDRAKLRMESAIRRPEFLTALRTLHPLKIQTLDQIRRNRESALGAFRIQRCPNLCQVDFSRAGPSRAANS